MLLVSRSLPFEVIHRHHVTLFSPGEVPDTQEALLNAFKRLDNDISLEAQVRVPSMCCCTRSNDTSSKLQNSWKLAETLSFFCLCALGWHDRCYFLISLSLVRFKPTYSTVTIYVFQNSKIWVEHILYQPSSWNILVWSSKYKPQVCPLPPFNLHLEPILPHDSVVFFAIQVGDPNAFLHYWVLRVAFSGATACVAHIDGPNLYVHKVYWRKVNYIYILSLICLPFLLDL